MQLQQIKIAFSVYQETFCIKIKNNSEIEWHETKIVDSTVGDISEKQMIFFILNKLNSVFYSMPFDKCEIACNSIFKEKYGHLLQFFQHLLSNNNAISLQLKRESVAVKPDGKYLFYNVEETDRFKQLYDKLVAIDAEKFIYKNLETGFDLVKREWRQQAPPLPVIDFIRYVVEQNITKIISINSYFLEQYFYMSGFHLMPLFRQLGVEYVIMDNDPKDQSDFGYLIKSAFHCNDFTHYCFDALNEYWDQYYDLKNIHYVSMLNNYDEQRQVAEMSENYSVLILSNSRLKDVVAQLGSVVLLLDQFSEDDTIHELELWYYATRHLILDVMPFPEYVKLRLNAKLFTLFYTAMQFVKFDVINGIEVPRQIVLHGDIGWQTLFPQYYRGHLEGEEKQAIFRSREYLLLLLNWQLAWIDASGPIYDAISRDIPFLSFAPVVATPEFKGLDRIVYRNGKELNLLIENAHSQFSSQDIKQSSAYLKHLYNESMESTATQLALNKPISVDAGEYGHQWVAHKVLLEEKIMHYLEEKEGFVRQMIPALLMNNDANHDLSCSRFYNKPYFQQLIAKHTERCG